MGVEIKQYLKRVNKENLDSEIEDCEDFITYCHEKILMMTVADPELLKPEEECYDKISYIRSEIKDLLEEYEDNIIKLNILKIAKDFPEDAIWDED